MKIVNEVVKIESCGGRVSYHDITKEVKDIVEKSGIVNGNVIIQSSHTTCSIIFEEYVHDRDFKGDEFLQVDMNKVLDNIIPREHSENTVYRYPGPKHLEFVEELVRSNDQITESIEEAYLYSLNGDAHLRASIFGASETFIIKEGVLLTGMFGYIYFVDFDQNRKRTRKCYVQVMGE